MDRRHSGQHGPDCFGCKIQNVNFDPRAMPSRRNRIPPKAKEPLNSWNRGVPRDSRGMPYLDPGDLSPIGQKKFSENRSQIDEARRKVLASGTKG